MTLCLRTLMEYGLLEILGDDMGVNGVVVKNKQEENPINLNLMESLSI